MVKYLLAKYLILKSEQSNTIKYAKKMTIMMLDSYFKVTRLIYK